MAGAVLAPPPAPEGSVVSPMSLRPTIDTIRQAPKVLLHDHLDGGLRPATVVELAHEHGYRDLPTTDVDDLARWFTEGANRLNLELYLETFQHTVGVMQTKDALQRGGRRSARPTSPTTASCTPRSASHRSCTWSRGSRWTRSSSAVLEGFAAGSRGRPITVNTLVTAMRQHAHSTEIAELAVRWRDAGVVGFDIAGPEEGFPPTRHLDAFQLIARGELPHHHPRRRGLRPAVDLGGGAVLRRRAARPRRPHRRRHRGRRRRPAAASGRLASFVRDRRVPLEMCPTSNVHTGAARSLAEHPIGLLARLRFRVTVNTDNRLMSACRCRRSWPPWSETFGFGWDDIEWLTTNAMKSAFAPFDRRLRIINEQIKPGFASLKASMLGVSVPL